MKLLKSISNLFHITNPISPTSALLNEQENTIEVFSYTDDGFKVLLKNKLCRVRWAEVERISAFIPGLTGIENNLMDSESTTIEISYNNNLLVLTEEIPGWKIFLNRLQAEFSITKDKINILAPGAPFEYNPAPIYERSDRVMPAKTNFNSVIKGKKKEDIHRLFEKYGWSIRKLSRTKYEFWNSWTDLVLQTNNDDSMLKGFVAYHPDNVKFIRKIFDKIGCSYNFEFYNGKNELIELNQNGV